MKTVGELRAALAAYRDDQDLLVQHGADGEEYGHVLNVEVADAGSVQAAVLVIDF